MSKISQLWTQIERPEGSRSNKVIRQLIWHTVGSGSHSSHSACHIPSQQGGPQSPVVFLALTKKSFGRSFRSFEAMMSRLRVKRLWLTRIKLVTWYVGLWLVRRWAVRAEAAGARAPISLSTPHPHPTPQILVTLITLLPGRPDNQILMRRGKVQCCAWHSCFYRQRCWTFCSFPQESKKPNSHTTSFLQTNIVGDIWNVNIINK